MNPIKTSTWSVRFTLPAGTKEKWALNLSAAVVALTSERAAAVIREAHPEAVIYAINHMGREVTYVDGLAIATLHYVQESEACPDNRRHPRTHLSDAHNHCVWCAGIIVAALQASTSAEPEKP